MCVSQLCILYNIHNLFSASVMGLLLYYHWEAMIVSYLSTRIISIPFNGIPSLITNTDYNILTLPGSVLADSFKHSKDSFWQRAWKERMEPFLDDYAKQYGTGPDEMKKFILENENFALYDRFSSVASFKEYLDCKIIVAPGKYDFKPLTYGFQKDSQFLFLFNHFLKEMREKGTMGQILTKYEPKPQNCPDYSGKPLGISTCISAFIILAFGIGICVLLFFLEMLVRSYHPRNTSERALCFFKQKSEEDFSNQP